MEQVLWDHPLPEKQESGHPVRRSGFHLVNILLDTSYISIFFLYKCKIKKNVNSCIYLTQDSQ